MQDSTVVPSAGFFDYVIVGGGSAGCVLANRLSARPDLRIALIEAGDDTPPGEVPQAILDSYPMPVFHGDTWIWPDLKARATHTAAPRVYEQGRVMGGGSAINVQSANRGLPRDYDEWAAMGAQGWDWASVLPYFCKLENDLDYGDQPLHGAQGPLPIRRIARHDWPTFGHAFAQGLEAFGLPPLNDQNAEFGDGYFPSSFSNKDDRRATTATAYLDTDVRARSNLLIRARLRVERLILQAGTVKGVVTIDELGQRLRFDAGEVILSAGALQSPALLMRAGIGDGDHLQSLGINTAHHLPGVGCNLQDHPALTLCHVLPRHLRMPLSRRRASMVAARLSSGIAGGDISDLYLSSATRAAWHALGNRLGLFFLWCNRPRSRGQVRLASADPGAMPAVELNLLSDAHDLASLAAGVRHTARIVAAASFGDSTRDFFPAAFSPRVKALSRVTPFNQLVTAIAGYALDLPAPLRRALVDNFFTRGDSMAEILENDESLRHFVRSNVFGVWHASGTCRMGSASDSMAVTDAQGRVHGIQGLRVVDASLMPRLPSANTNIPTIMMAEKISAAMALGTGH